MNYRDPSMPESPLNCRLWKTTEKKLTHRQVHENHGKQSLKRRSPVRKCSRLKKSEGLDLTTPCAASYNADDGMRET